jgi:ketosteroid isomerase-like protein
MSTAELVAAHLANIGNPSHAEIYTDDVVAEFPYAPRHHTGKLSGSEAVLNFLMKIGLYFQDIRVGEPTVHLTANPDVVILEYPGTSVSKETGLPYSQDYVSVLTLRAGRISHIREYYNPVKVLVATGEMQEPGG